MRIIAGRYRGRWLEVPAQPGLRPTGNRIRETLFNWLAPVVEGARCLDLFAGSGALGFEAASRGAARVVLVDSNPAQIRLLVEARDRLQAETVEVVAADALDWLASPAPGQFDLVFVDPPFQAGLTAGCCAALASGGWLAAGALVYLETARRAVVPQLPPVWTVVRAREAGEVRYLLVRAGDQQRGVKT